MKNLYVYFLLALAFTMTLSPPENIKTNDNTINISNLNDLNDFNKPTTPGPITKESQLDTTTTYNGETIYITIDNGTNLHLPTTYRYNSINNITHNITFYDVGGVDEFCFFTPNTWNFTSYGSAENLTYDSINNCWIYTHTGGAEFDTFLFLSGETYGIDYARNNQFYPLEEYFYDDFTSNYSNWVEINSFEEIGLNNTIYSNSSNSIRLFSDTTDSNSIYLDQSFDEGNYYISCRIFVETWVSGTLNIQYYDKGFQNFAINVSSIEQTRFQLIIKRIEINGNSTYGDSIRIEFTSGNGTILIDQFKVYSISPKFVNTDTIYQYNISISYITVDTLQDFPVNNVNFTLYGISRIYNITFLTINNYTNSLGYYSQLYTNSSLSLTELEIKSVHTNSSQEDAPIWSFDYNNSAIHLKMDENIGVTTYDSTINNNDGTLNSPDWINSKSTRLKYALDFDHTSSDRMTISDSPELSHGNNTIDTNYTITCWIKTDGTTGTGQTICSKYGNLGFRELYIYINADLDLFFNLYDGSNDRIGRSYTGSALLSDTWYFLAFVYNGNMSSTGVEIFVNSVAVSDGDANAGVYDTPDDTTQIFELGSRSSGTTRFFNGIIDDFRIYNKTLNSTELYNYSSFFNTNDIDPSTNPISIYIQPRNIVRRDYREDNSLNIWDFKFTTEYFIGFDLTETEENGYIKGELESGGSSILGISNLNVNANYYNRLLINIQTNDKEITVKPSDSILDIGIEVTINGSFTLIDWEFNSNWIGTETYLYLVFDELDGVLDGDEIFYIDFIQLYHEIDQSVINYPSTVQYKLLSENNSLTYAYYHNSNLGTNKIDNIIYDMPQYTNQAVFAIFKDSLYPTSLLIPGSNLTRTFQPDFIKTDEQYNEYLHGFLDLLWFGVVCMFSVLFLFWLIRMFR